ncbi:MAG: ankyrin repeat domain-containing protein [Candidatus Korobacteraceae bacterium]|jgi:ankyrin repeat protein
MNRNVLATPHISRRAAATLVALILLVSSSPVFGGEIHDAAANGKLEKVKKLLERDPELVSSKDNEGATPLHYAAAFGRKDVAELLLASKADVNARDNGGRTPLHYAAAFGRADITELLLANGAEVSAKDNYGATPMLLTVLCKAIIEENSTLKKSPDKVGLKYPFPSRTKGIRPGPLTDEIKLLRQHGG